MLWGEMLSESLLKLGNIERLDSEILIKSSQNKMGQKDFQVHSFWYLFLQLAAEKKTPKNGAVVTSLRTFIRSSAFDR